MTTTASTSLDERTTVRAKMRSKRSRRLELLRGTLQVVGRTSPRLAAVVAERLFRTPPSYRPARGEDDSVFFADPFQVRFGERTLQAWSFGEGPAVLLVHGWGGRGTQLRSFVDPIVRSGRRAILFDAPGHGGSGGGMASL